MQEFKEKWFSTDFIEHHKLPNHYHLQAHQFHMLKTTEKIYYHSPFLLFLKEII